MPHFDVQPSVGYDPERLRVLTAEKIIDGFMMVCDYEHLQ